jgi:uncharacterized protein YggE
VLADIPLGRAQAISDVVVTPVSQSFSDEAARSLAADTGTPIHPGEVTTRVTVSTRFELR